MMAIHKSFEKGPGRHTKGSPEIIWQRKKGLSFVVGLMSHTPMNRLLLRRGRLTDPVRNHGWDSPSMPNERRLEAGFGVFGQSIIGAACATCCTCSAGFP